MRQRPLLRVLVVLALAGLAYVGIALFRARQDTRAHSLATGSSAASGATSELGAVPADARAPLAGPRAGGTKIRVVAVGTNEPIAGASIDVLSLEGGDLQLVTDDQGVVLCDPASLQEARVDIRAAGWCAAQYNVPQTVKGDLQFALCAAGDVAVHVRDESGKPMPNMQILPMITGMDLAREVNDSIQKAWPNWVDMKTQPLTDLNGDRLIKDMPRGFELAFSANIASARVTLDATTPVTPVEIVVDLQRCFTGRLVWEDGSIVKDLVAVTCVDTPDPTSPCPRGATYRDGRFEVCGVPKGRFNWKIEYPGEKFRVARVESESLDVGDIVLLRALECTGRVQRRMQQTDSDYQDIGITTWQSGAPDSSWSFVEKDGKFSVRLPAGPAVLVVSSSVGRKPLRSVPVVSPFNGLVIDLDGFFGSVRIDNTGLDKGRRFLLRVHERPTATSGETSIIAAHDSRFGSRSATLYVRTDLGPNMWCGNSLCVRDLRPGAVDIYASTTDRAEMWYFGQTVVIADKEVILDAALVKPGVIHVRAHDPDGKPTAGFEVEAQLEPGMRDGFKRRNGTTGADGTLVLADLVAGRWRVYPRAHGSDSDDVQIVDLDPNEMRTVDMQVPGAGSVVGTVTSGVAPASGITVSIMLAETGHTVTRSALGPFKTDDRGRYRFDQVLEGQYDIVFGRRVKDLPTIRFTSRRVQVHAGEEVRCDLDLDGSYRQIVFQLDGKPFDGVDAAMVYTSDGMHSVERRPELCEGWSASIRGGPCFFQMWSRNSIPDYETLPEREHFAALVQTVDTSKAPIVVDLRGGRIDVHPTSANELMPWAHIASVDGFPSTTPFVDHSKLVHEDANGVRSFAHLPVGSIVVLETDPRSTDTLVQRTVHITTEATVDVTWPPR